MNLSKICFSLFLCTFVAFMAAAQNNTAADSKTNMKDSLDYGIPINEFPTPANAETAGAIVNFNLDYMGLNAGENELHVDEKTKVKFKAYLNPSIKAYSLFAINPDGGEVPVKVEKCETNPSCQFAYVDGKTWINVLCSQVYAYNANARKLEQDTEEAKEIIKEEQKQKQEASRQRVLERIKQFDEKEKGKKHK